MPATVKLQRKARDEMKRLRVERREVLSGDFLPWGMPWCPGPGAAHHQEPCEGCAGRGYLEYLAAPLEQQLAALDLLAQFGPPPTDTTARSLEPQGVLF